MNNMVHKYDVRNSKAFYNLCNAIIKAGKTPKEPYYSYKPFAEILKTDNTGDTDKKVHLEDYRGGVLTCKNSSGKKIELRNVSELLYLVDLGYTFSNPSSLMGKMILPYIDCRLLANNNMIYAYYSVILDFDIVSSLNYQQCYLNDINKLGFYIQILNDNTFSVNLDNRKAKLKNGWIIDPFSINCKTIEEAVKLYCNEDKLERLIDNKKYMVLT